MRLLRFAPLLALLAGPAQAQVAATDWSAQCWTQGGGHGPRWCQAAVEFSARQGPARFKGSIRLMRAEHGEPEAVISGDAMIERGSLQVDDGVPRPATEDYDAKLAPADARAIVAALRTGKLLIVRLTPKGMAPVAFSLDLEGYRTALRHNPMMQGEGW